MSHDLRHFIRSYQGRPKAVAPPEEQSLTDCDITELVAELDKKFSGVDMREVDMREVGKR